MTPIFLMFSFIVIIVLLEYRRSIAGSFNGLKGGSPPGLLLAYAGSLLLVAAQFYTIVKRSAWIGFIKKVGGVRPWLSIHITLSFIGLIAVLVHAGFPYRFNSIDLLNHGLAGLTTWLLIASAASGVFGRYIYKRLPAMKRTLQLLETITPADNRTTVLRRDHPYDHGLRQLGFGEFFDNPRYPFASLNEHVDPLVLVRRVSVALGMVTANSDRR